MHFVCILWYIDIDDDDVAKTTLTITSMLTDGQRDNMEIGWAHVVPLVYFG